MKLHIAISEKGVQLQKKAAAADEQTLIRAVRRYCSVQRGLLAGAIIFPVLFLICFLTMPEGEDISGILYLPVLAVFFCAALPIHRFAGRVNCTCTLDASAARAAENASALAESLRANRMIWHAKRLVRNRFAENVTLDRRTLTKKPVSLIRGTPFVLKVNAPCHTLKLKGGSLIFLPWALMLISGNYVRLLPYSELRQSCSEIRYAEEHAPSDTPVLQKTGPYRNLKTRPDPSGKGPCYVLTCVYGDLVWEADRNFRIELLLSNPDTLSDVRSAFSALQSCCITV